MYIESYNIYYVNLSPAQDPTSAHDGLQSSLGCEPTATGPPPNDRPAPRMQKCRDRDVAHAFKLLSRHCCRHPTANQKGRRCNERCRREWRNATTELDVATGMATRRARMRAPQKNRTFTGICKEGPVLDSRRAIRGCRRRGAKKSQQTQSGCRPGERCHLLPRNLPNRERS